MERYRKWESSLYGANIMTNKKAILGAQKRDNGTYRSAIVINGVRHHLGIFKTAEDAEKMIALGVKRIGTSSALAIVNGEKATGEY